MFKRVFQLAKVLRQGSGFIGRDKEINDSNKSVGSSAALVTPVIIAIIAIGLLYLSFKFSNMIELIGGAELLLTVVFLIAALISLVLTFLELINTMYMSSDLPSLIVLPLSSTEIVSARLINAARLQFCVAAVAILPSLIGFGLATGAGFMFFLTGILGVILVPLFSVFAAAVLVILIMTFVRIFRNRNVLAIIGVVLAFLAFIAYFAFANSGDTSVDKIGDTVLNLMQALSGFANVFPIVPLLVSFYVTNNALMLLAAIGLVVVLLAVLYLFARLFYLQGAMAMHSGGKSKKPITDLAAVTKKHSTAATLTKRELKTVFRTPAFFLYGWIITLFWPVVVIVPIILKVNLGELLSQIFGLDTSGIADGTIGITMTALACVLCCIISLLIVGMSNFAYNSISRDGQFFFFDRIIPISFKEQIRAKRNAALIVSLIGTTGYVLIGTLFLIFALKLLPLWSLVPILIISITTTILMNNLQIWLGSRHINLSWSDEAVVGKSTSVVLMIIGFVSLFAIPIALIVSLINGVDPLAWIIGLIIVSAIGALLTERFALRAAARHMSEA